MTSEGLGEMFEGDSADTCAGKFPLVSMGGRAEGLGCADPGARTPIGASGIVPQIYHHTSLYFSLGLMLIGFLRSLHMQGYGVGHLVLHMRTGDRKCRLHNDF